YGRVCIRKKQETAREIRRFPCGFNILICAALKDTEVNFLNAIYTLLVVDRVFRQSAASQLIIGMLVYAEKHFAETNQMQEI
ncbi:MAG: hypothetical protein PUB07_08445, partial [Clostridia bacterium]|nr:hypothetical protein [Clostridia bacterium]